MPDMAQPNVGEKVRVAVEVDTHAFNNKGLGVELVAIRTSLHNNDKLYEVEPLKLVKAEGTHLFFETTYQFELDEWASELKASLSKQPEAKTKEEKKALKRKERQIKELEKHKEKLSEYDSQLSTIGERRSCSKTDKDATFMRMKEDAKNNGQTKPGYNL